MALNVLDAFYSNRLWMIMIALTAISLIERVIFSTKLFPVLPVSRKRFFLLYTIFSYTKFRRFVKVILSSFPQLDFTSSVFVCLLFSITSSSLSGGYLSDAGLTWILCPWQDHKC